MHQFTYKSKETKVHAITGENGQMPISKKKKKIQHFAQFLKLIRELSFFSNSIFSKSSYKKKKTNKALYWRFKDR